jgi:hypothetical protein
MKMDRLASCLGLMAATAGAGCAAQEPDFYPASCEELRAHHRDSGEPGLLLDDEYTLFVDNDPGRGWRAYCEGMRGTAPPRSYLPLNRSGQTFNYSEIVGSETDGVRSALRTHYDMIRIDPATLEIDLGDTAPGVSEGDPIEIDGDEIAQLPIGVAIACGGRVATANLDLSETGLQLAPDIDPESAFCAPDEDEATTMIVVSEPDHGSLTIVVAPPGEQTADTCTWVTPKPCNSSPWRDGAMAGTTLQLSLRSDVDVAADTL